MKVAKCCERHQDAWSQVFPFWGGSRAQAQRVTSRTPGFPSWWCLTERWRRRLWLFPRHIYNAPTTSLYILSYWHVDNMLHLVYQTITEYQFDLLSTDQHSECRLKTTMKPSCNRRACLPRSGSAPVATLDASDTATPKLAMIETRDEQNRSSLPSCSLPSVSLFMLFSHHHRHGGGTASVTTEELLRHRQF